MLNKTDYIVIVCPGHSGSTLLAMALNSHDNVHVFGEFASLRKRVHDIRHGTKRALCSFCGEDCDVFGQKELRLVARCYFNRYGKVSRFKQLVTHPLYVRHLLKRSSCRFIGDSSKSVEWAKFLERNLSWVFDLRYVFLIRDPRAVVAAHLRQNKPVKHITEKYMVEMESLLNLRRRVETKRNSSKSIVIRYEDLAEHPQHTLERLAGFLDLPFQHSMLEYDRHEHHIIGGNDKARSRAKIHRGQKINMKNNTQWFLDQKENFFLDERWKGELSAEQVRCIEGELGHMMAKLGYQAGGVE